MKPSTNEYGQPTDSKGKTLKTRELIAEAITAIISRSRILKDGTPVRGEVNENTLLLNLVEFVMEHENAEYARNVMLGVGMGRMDVVRMLEAVVSISVNRELTPTSEIRKVIKALRQETKR